MRVEQLQLINKTETSNNVLNFLVRKDKVASVTNLESFRVFLCRKGYKVAFQDFIKLFKDLEEAGAGKLEDYKGTNPTKFIWYYSFKDVADQILNPNKMIELHLIDYEKATNKDPIMATVTPIKETQIKRKGRPKGAINKPKESTIISGPAITRSPSKEIYLVFATDKNEAVVMSMKEAERFCEHYKAVKERMTL